MCGEVMPTSNSQPPLDDGEIRENSQADWIRLSHWSLECFICGESTTFGYVHQRGADRELRRHLLKDHLRAEPRIRVMALGCLPFEQKERAHAIAAELVTALGAGIACPNCGAELQEKKATERWRRCFECDDCTRAFHFVVLRDQRGVIVNRPLEQGRELR